MMQAIALECDMRSPALAGLPVHTIYLGGGTPSLVPVHLLHALMVKIKETAAVDADAEITLESNPDDITPERLQAWKQMGINRLSIGIQSFYEEDLKWMNRAHNAHQALQSVQSAVAAGFANYSIDLIYGTPGLSHERWVQNLAQAIALRVPHISAYALTVEPHTALDTMIKKGKATAPVDDHAALHFHTAIQMLASAGYEHYEISNWALPGCRSRHNSSYWQGAPYMGLGPSAHSFDGAEKRSWMVANNALYMNAIEAGELPETVEQLTPVQRRNEYIMTGIRTLEGIHLEKLAPYKLDAAVVAKYVQRGWINSDAHNLFITNQGKPFADGIAADLFLSETNE